MVCAFQILDVFSSKACTLDSHNQTSVDDSGDRARQNSRVLLDCNDSWISRPTEIRQVPVPHDFWESEGSNVTIDSATSKHSCRFRRSLGWWLRLVWWIQHYLRWWGWLLHQASRDWMGHSRKTTNWSEVDWPCQLGRQNFPAWKCILQS